MQMRKSNGRNINPCDTPALTRNQSDVRSFSKTFRDILMSSNKSPGTPVGFNL